MDSAVLFRKFEERDIDFIYQCKNDEKLNSLIVGQYRPITYEEASQWVRNCMKGDRPDLRYWAMCSNDEERRIVGWTSLSEIDYDNKSAFFHGITVADPQYRNGLAWIEAQLFVPDYAFNELKINRLEFTCLTAHKISMSIGPTMFYTHEGTKRSAIYKDGRYYDLALFAILKDEYQKHLENGDYERDEVLLRFANYSKKK